MFILEGTIGAGKSTFLRLIAQEVPAVHIALEPLHNWQSHVYGQSLLAQFYHAPQRWSYTMETFAMMCRVQEHIKDQTYPNPLYMVERSIYSGHYCFALNGYENGFMNDLEWAMYDSFFKFLIPGHCKAPQGFIYLSVDPEMAYERIKKRNRVAEKEITRTYLKQIGACHDRFLLKKENVLAELKEVPVLVLDVNEDFETNAAHRAALFAQVHAFMNQNILANASAASSSKVATV